MNCLSGGFPSVQHNEVQDLTSAFLSEVCHNVHTEPTFQPSQGVHLRYKSANELDLMLLHRISGEMTTKLPTLMSEYSTHLLNPSMSKCYRKHELDKKREYEERVREIE